MGTSYSKLRHIQEANLRLEQQRIDEQSKLINNIGSKIKGAVAGAKTTMRNLSGKSGSFRESPKLANILAQMKNRAKAMNQQISYFGTEFQNLEQEVNTLKTKNPAYATEADRLMEIVKKYQLAMQAAYEAGGVFLRESGEYKQGQAPTPAQPQAPTEIQPNPQSVNFNNLNQQFQPAQPAQPTQQNLSPEEQALLQKYPGMTLQQALDADYEAKVNNPMNYSPDAYLSNSPLPPGSTRPGYAGR